MSCCKKRGQQKIKRYSQNRIIPYADSVTIREYTEKINNEIIKCHYCQRKYKLSENKISIHCSGCDQFFHCHIAGECLGEDCTHIIQGIKKHEMYFFINSLMSYRKVAYSSFRFTIFTSNNI